MEFWKKRIFFLWQKLVSRYQSDLRSVMAFRILCGLAVCLDALRRMPNAHAHYGSGGLLYYFGSYHDFSQWGFSLYDWLGDQNGTVIAVLTIHALCGLLLALGVFPRLLAVACWFLTISIQNRNPFVLQGADVALRLALLFSVPIVVSSVHGRLASVRPKNVAPAFTLPILLFLCSIYLINVSDKLSVPSWRHGTAIFDALGVLHLATPIALFVRGFTGIMPALTYLTILTELFIPVLVLAFYSNPLLRMMACSIMIFFHLGTGILFNIGIFPLVMAALWALFLPALFWNILGDLTGFRIASEKNEAAPRGTNVLWLTLSLYVCAIGIAARVEGHPNTLFLNGFTNLLRLDQSWTMFKDPFSQIDGELAVASMSTGSKSDFQTTVFTSKRFTNDRWIKFFMLAAKGNVYLQKGLLKYVCEQDGENAEKLLTLSFQRFQKRPYPDAVIDRYPPRSIMTYNCQLR